MADRTRLSGPFWPEKGVLSVRSCPLGEERVGAEDSGELDEGVAENL